MLVCCQINRGKGLPCFGECLILCHADLHSCEQNMGKQPRCLLEHARQGAGQGRGRVSSRGGRPRTPNPRPRLSPPQGHHYMP